MKMIGQMPDDRVDDRVDHECGHDADANPCVRQAEDLVV